MKRRGIRKALSALVFCALVFAFALPATAFAANSEVQVDNHTAAGQQKTLTQISIDGVAAPQVGAPLDDRARVSSAEGETWEIPVLWVDDYLNVATEAVEGRAYLPALVFFVPQGCFVEGGAFTVTLSESLAKLFGDEEALSVYDAGRDVTYILPASLRDFFAAARAQAASASGSAGGQSAEELPAAPAGPTQIGIHCAQTARTPLTEEDLNWLLDLVKNTLEPQAVNLLISKFPAFSAAAAKQQIGREIGLYVYLATGDMDGIPEHERASGALAYVTGETAMKDGALTYCYIIGVNVASLVNVDEEREPIRDATTGKLTLLRSGKPLETLNNTIVHEVFHAFMDDYNRTGMLGAKNVQDGYFPNGEFKDNAQKEAYYTVHFPMWFIEGTASAVENVYQYRYDSFQKLREKIVGSLGDLEDTFTKDCLLYNYVLADPYFDLEYSSSGDINTTRSKYVGGYLATLYLSNLAAKKDASIGDAKNADGSFSNEKLRSGLNSILERLHKGETLDAVIKDISTVGNSSPMYASADDFEKLFIKGVKNPNWQPEQGNGQRYITGDASSMAFTLDFLNYLLTIEKTPGRTNKPNGSILFDFAGDYALPLDSSKEASSDFYRIVDANTLVPSTVPDAVAFASGGKSEQSTLAAASEAEMPMAAKAPVSETVDDQAHIAPGSDEGAQAEAPMTAKVPVSEDADGLSEAADAPASAVPETGSPQ